MRYFFGYRDGERSRVVNCIGRRRDDGTWQCRACGWVYKKPADQFPRRNCPVLTANPMRVGLWLEWMLRFLGVTWVVKRTWTDCGCSGRARTFDSVSAMAAVDIDRAIRAYIRRTPLYREVRRFARWCDAPMVQFLDKLEQWEGPTPATCPERQTAPSK